MSPVVHLTEDQIQGLADSTLRGPEGMAAREHADTCEECGAELAMYGALVQRLATLQDPMPPADTHFMASARRSGCRIPSS